jgi:transposase
MAHVLVDEDLWALVKPLLPPPKPRRTHHPGRKRIDDRKALTGILFVLKTGIPWEYLPQEMGCGCGMTCWRRLQEWHNAGVWQRMHEVILACLNWSGELDWSRAVIDSSSIRAVAGGEKNWPKSHGQAQTGQQASSAH